MPTPEGRWSWYVALQIIPVDGRLREWSRVKRLGSMAAGSGRGRASSTEIRKGLGAAQQFLNMIPWVGVQAIITECPCVIQESEDRIPIQSGFSEKKFFPPHITEKSRDRSWLQIQDLDSVHTLGSPFLWVGFLVRQDILSQGQDACLQVQASTLLPQQPQKESWTHHPSIFQSESLIGSALWLCVIPDPIPEVKGRLLVSDWPDPDHMPIPLARWKWI